MFGNRKRKTPACSAVPNEPNDQFRLKATGQRVTLLSHLGNGEVKIAMDTEYITRDAIVSVHDITPA